MNYLSGNISYLRKFHQISEEEFTGKCNLITPLDHIELGTIEPTMDELLCIAGFLNYPVDRLLQEDLAETLEKLKEFRFGLLALDVDGVLTDGGMFYSQSGDEIKKFNTKDGLALIRLTEAGKKVAFLSSGAYDNIIKKRAVQLGVQFVQTGTWKKLECIEKWCAELQITMENVAYIGDDANDLAVIEHVGLSACPADASSVIRSTVDVILEKRGGQGCVREFIDRFIMKIV
jgi:3-deoxy-D-manno-octulosonate 8-phosphate phosphatase (KDO 8-P phosphatase)